MLLVAIGSTAQTFYNLTPDDVRIDSVLPRFACTTPLHGAWADSVYTVRVEYPEYIDMSPADIAAYKRLSGAPRPALPEVESYVVVNRKQAALEAQLMPIVQRDGHWQWLVSFMLKVEAQPAARAARMARAASGTATQADADSPAARYAANSVLRSGRWAKIRVPSTGVYRLTDQVIRSAGFTDMSKVRIYGYGGNLLNEQLVGSELADLDDLKEVPTCTIGGRRLFYAHGPVTWTTSGVGRRVRNPYSSYGCYFITQDDSAEPARVDSAEFVGSFYPSPYYYHTLYENDGYAWYHGGRNLCDPTPIPVGSSQTVKLERNPNATAATVTVVFTAATDASVQVELADGQKKSATLRVINPYDYTTRYNKANEQTVTLTCTDLSSFGDVKLTTTSGGPVRLDYVDVTWDKPLSEPSLSAATIPAAEYVYNITNQNHHADPQADMVIIIPTSQKLLAQAERLKAFHEQHDGMRVSIVPADELYNEFSSGTPDVSAYRRYMKMLYDRAATDADMPRYLLLFGDGVWDNRMLTSDCRTLNADDYLLCFESENSYSATYCYVDDGFCGLLDDGEGLHPDTRDKLDVAVGRFPVTTDAQAKVMVDKVLAYSANKNAGAWQNTIMFMGDDGDQNMHMRDINDTADDIATRYPGYTIKKVMWDSYKRESSATGFSYPEVTRTVKQQQQAGALIMDYGGHGSEIQISHENVLRITDFSSFSNTNLPLWITAACDILPFDDNTSTIGEEAVLNAKGGAVAFYGTTRTVFTGYNKAMNKTYLKHVLSTVDGKAVTIGEAQRLAKNELITSGSDPTVNKLQYSLLGDPAMPLALPSRRIVIDRINGVSLTDGGDMPQMKAGTVATVSGHIEGDDTFSGTMSATVRDAAETVTCQWNERYDTDGPDKPFTYTDRTKYLFVGNDSIRAGQFEFSFPVPKDINYTDKQGLINIHAVSADKQALAHGWTDSFIVGGADIADNDSIGPSVYCYLNSPQFANGGNVNTTPYFVAEIKDEDGINVSGNGIGHDLQLVIDGSMVMTYNLNDNFSYDFGSYTSGRTYYSLPELEPGEHRLLFRAWDVLNNSSVTELRFNVVKGLGPRLFDVACTQNPATTSTTFVISHDRTGSTVDVEIDIFDMSGRHLWRHSESGVSTDSSYTVDWDLTVGGGEKLQTGVYLYRASISCDGSSKTSKAKKLIVIGNK